MGDESASSKSDGSFGFLHRILSMFAGSDDPEREKRRLMKQLGKELSRQKNKFYKPRTTQALPNLAKFFHEIYKVVGPAQSLLSGADESAALRTILIESQHTEEQSRLRNEFDEKVIRERAAGMDAKKLTSHVKDAMVTYFSGFDAATVKRINDTFSLLQLLLSFVKYDYYFVLRKFDSGIQEGNFSYNPRFDSINAEYVSDDIKDFLEVALVMPKDADWDTVFDVLREYKGVEVFDRAAWKRALGQLVAVLRSGILVKIVQHVDGQPSWTVDVQPVRKHIVESYLNLLKTQVEATMQKLSRERRGQKVEQLVKAIFGTAAVQRTKFYTDAANMVFTKKMIAGFLHVEPVNYLKAFLLDYFKGEVRMVISDLFIVRGQWSDNILSQQLSDSYYAIMNVAQQIVEFDDSLGEEGELGMKLKKASGRVMEKDPASAKLLRQTLSQVNEEAIGMVNTTAANLITLGKIVKQMIDDLERDRPELVLNWGELQGYSEKDLKTQLVQIYKRSYFFVQLMQMYVKKA